jgi:hypothetical protein
MMAGVPQTNHALRLNVPNKERTMTSSVLRLQSPAKSDSQMAGSRICFIHQYDWQESATGTILMEQYDPFQIGGWTTTLVEGADDHIVLQGGMTTYEVDQPIKVDTNAGTVTLEATNEPFATINLGSETTTSAGNTITVERSQDFYLVNEAWILNEGGLADVEGRILDDGSIVIEDGFGYYIEDVVTTTITSKGTTRVMSDTTRSVSLIYRDVRLMKPNGKHEFVNESNGESRICDVYMYQSGDTVYVMNLYGYGWGENYMVLYEGGTMSYPEQPMRDIVDADYPDGAGLWYNTSVVDGEMVEGCEGLVTSEAITWDLTRPSDHDGLWYGWDSNRLYFTDGQSFVVPSSGGSSMRGDVNEDGEVSITDATILIDSLLSGDFSTINQENADADLDGVVSISDVTAIIDYLMSGYWTN